MKLYKDTTSYGIASAIIGALSMVTWLIPLIGIITSFAAIMTGLQAIDNEQDGWALAGIVLGIAGFILTFVRSGLVYFYG